MLTYSELRPVLVQRMLAPNAISIRALARETGIPQSTLWRWRLEALQSSSSSESSMPSSKPTEFSPEQKLHFLLQAGGLANEQLGAFLRSNGLQEAQILAWRQEALQGLTASRPASQTAEVRQLQADLHRKEKALAEAATLILLQKKTSLLLADMEPLSQKKNAF